MFNLGKERELPALLLIDDDMVSREVMATVLTMEGYTVHTAASGDAALEKIDRKECAPGLILLDAQMPGLSGLPLIAELRRRTQAPVFSISASNPPEEVVQAADAFLLKPFPASALTRLVEERAAAALPAANPRRLPAEPVVSPATLEQLRALMPPSAVREIFTALVADLVRRIDAMALALGAGEIVEVRRIAHAIKGGCAMAGALQAARIAAEIESGNVSGDNQLDNSARLLADLRLARENLERMLESEFRA